jgi:hypothetical protein
LGLHRPRVSSGGKYPGGSGGLAPRPPLPGLRRFVRRPRTAPARDGTSPHPHCRR